VDTPRSIEQVLRQLAEWHRAPAADRHYTASHDESALGIMTAVTDLDLAAQQAEGLQEHCPVRTAATASSAGLVKSTRRKTVRHSLPVF